MASMCTMVPMEESEDVFYCSVHDDGDFGTIGLKVLPFDLVQCKAFLLSRWILKIKQLKFLKQSSSYCTFKF